MTQQLSCEDGTADHAKCRKNREAGGRLRLRTLPSNSLGCQIRLPRKFEGK